MIVKRIVTNIAAKDLDRAKNFYSGILGLHIIMDHGWILTFAGEGTAAPQISVATEGGSGTPVPDVSIEVDDLKEIHQRVGYGRTADRVRARTRAVGSDPVLRPRSFWASTQHTCP
jgi:catechol 2,3-dioxygenase-like lactoylglutathione lyase family enzyme